MFFALFSATIDVKRNIFDLCTDTKDCYLAVIEVKSCQNVMLESGCFFLLCLFRRRKFCFLVPQNQDSVNTDTVCRLYEVGRQRLAEEEEEDEEDQVLIQSF